VVYSIYMALVLFKPARLLLVVILGTFFFAQFSYAALPCGNIINDEDVTPISDCSDPFGVSSPTYPHTLKINGVEVLPNNEILISETGVADYLVTVAPHVFDISHKFYLHDGDDYRLVPSGISELEESDYYEAAAGFFPEGFNSEPYVLFLLGDYSAGDEEGFDFDLLDDFEGYLNEQFPEVNIPLLPGTYTLVSEEILIFQTYEDSIFKKIRELFISTAWAQEFPSGPIHTLTFTLTAESLEPAGASSILFLPGIMGSRLYEESDVCDSEVVEQERWFSTSECDHERLSTNFLGDSINDLYTKPEESAIVDEAFSQNLYKSFLSELEDWKDNEIIADYKAVPYDWRLSLEDILQTKSEDGRVIYDSSIAYYESYLYKTLESLVESSLSGKVMIVTHSNGGLLAKYLLKILELENDPLLDKISHLVLVGVPQVGTPESVVGILHGSEIGPGGFVLSQETSRFLMGNMAFAHHLLPHEAYFDTVDTPVIEFDTGTSTNAWRNQFGPTITDTETLESFLSKSSGRTVPDREDLATPAVVDGVLFTYKDLIDSLLSSWSPPEDMKVYQVAGTGLPTPSKIEYFTDRECVSRNPLLLFSCTGYQDKLGYRIVETIDGDQTVVVPSALAMAENNQVERWWLDLLSYNDENNLILINTHKNILEIDEVIEFVDHINQDTEGVYSYLSNSEPEIEAEDRLVFQLHSPLDLMVFDGEGNIVSSSTSEIEGSIYRRYGELQYISVPAETEGLRVRLVGQAFGSFTLDIEKWSNGSRTESNSFSGIPSGSNTIVSLLAEEDISDFELSVDYDGDGESEGVYLTSGDFVPEAIEEVVEEEQENESTRSSSSSGTRVTDRVVPPGLVAGVTTSVGDLTEEERLKELVRLLTELVRLLQLVNK
jgi:hypothetical protein